MLRKPKLSGTQNWEGDYINGERAFLFLKKAYYYYYY